jgi:predicted membrane protein
MRNRTQLYIGLGLILIGIITFLGIFFNYDFGAIFCPSILILIGIWLLVRPRTSVAGTENFRFVGDVRRRGDWKVEGQEYWGFVGDVDLDFTQAQVPEGETVIRSYGFVGTVRAYAPENVGVQVTSNAFISNVRMFEQKQDSFISPVEMATPGYNAASRKVRIEAIYFISDVKIRRPEKR